MDDEVRDRLLTYVEQTTDFVGVTDDSGRVVYLNPAALRRLGRSPDEVSSLSTADLFPGLVFDRYFDEIRPVLMSGKPWSGVLPVLTAEGTADVWFTIVGGVGLGGDVGWLVTSGRNVTSWINDRNLLSWRATHDELTGVARRVVLGERIEAALARVRRSGKPLALIYLDLDRFKDVNDRFGHPVGDTVLAEFGRRLSSAVREVDTVVRVGGDEFVVLLEGVADRAQAELLRSRLVAALTSSPVLADGNRIDLSVSAGLALGGEDADADELVRQADQAMYSVKRLLTEARPDEFSPQRILAARQVEVALTQQEVDAHLQPIVTLSDGALVGVQSLARLNGGDSAEFVQSVAGLPVEVSLDGAMLRRSVTKVVASAQLRNGDLYVHVSGAWLTDPTAVVTAVDLLASSGFDPSLLVLEVPFPVLESAPDGSEAALATLRRLGVRIAASHVGGYGPADLGFLRGMVDEVVLDRAVTRSVDAARRDDSSLRDLVIQASEYWANVVAVGVETEQERAWWAEAGCSRGTGRLFGLPAPG